MPLAKKFSNQEICTHVNMYTCAHVPVLCDMPHSRMTERNLRPKFFHIKISHVTYSYIHNMYLQYVLKYSN
jgi:hypothetical protein